MKLSDWIARGPAFVSFGRRGSGISAIRSTTSVTLVADSGVSTEIPAVDTTLAGVMTASDKVALDAFASATLEPAFQTLSAASAAIPPASAQTLRLAGRSAAGDNGGAVYRRVGSPPLHPGKLLTADGAWWEISEPRIFAEMLGAKGDGTTDDTAAIEAALATLEALGGGYLHFGPGTFIATIRPDANGRTKIRGVTGHRGGTVLRAPGAGIFALMAQADQEFKVESLTFDGTVGGVGRRGCGVYQGRVGSQAHVVDCRFQNCLIGYARQDSYYGLIDRCFFQSNDLGIFAGTRGAGTESIAGLKDAGGAAQSVTLPTPANANGHAGNFAVTNCRINGNRIGVAILPTSQGAPHIRFEKTTIEGQADIGVIAARAPDLTFSQCWTEANQGESTATITLDGNTVNKGNLVLVDNLYATPSGGVDFSDESGTTVRWDGGVLAGVRTAPRGEVHIRNARLSGNSATVFSDGAGGSITAESVDADNLSLPGIVGRAPLPTLGRNRALLIRMPMPVGRIWQAGPASGSVRCAEDFTGATTYTSARLVNWGTATRTWGTAGGFWNASATCLEVVGATGGQVGFRLQDPLGAAAPAGYIGLLLSCRIDIATPLLTINGPGGPAFVSNLPIPGSNEWVTLGAGWLREAAADLSPIVLIGGDGVNPITVRFGAFQVCHFTGRNEMAAWFRTGALYATEM